MAEGLGQVCEGLSVRVEIFRLHIYAGVVITQEIHTIIRMYRIYQRDIFQDLSVCTGVSVNNAT